MHRDLFNVQVLEANISVIKLVGSIIILTEEINFVGIF